MTASMIVAIILGWLLINTWLTLLMIQLNKEIIAGWEDLAWCALMSVVSPVLVYVVCIVYWKVKRWQK